MFLWGKNNATFHWINEGIHSINAEISISVVSDYADLVMSVEWIRMNLLVRFSNVLEGRRKKGRQRLRWKHQVDESLQKLDVKNWREKAKDRAS